MEREIRQVQGANEFLQYGHLQANAYTTFGRSAEFMAERVGKLSEQDEKSTIWGLFENNQMLGCMRLLDMTLNYFGGFIPAGGVGSVAVGLAFKKQKVAYQLLQFYLDYYQKQGAHLALLYPFRPDFYYKMGFGYATKGNLYNFSPASLPSTAPTQKMRYLGPKDLPALQQFSEVYAAQQHGFCQRSHWELNSMIEGHAANGTLVGYFQGDRLMAYIAYGYEKGHASNFNINHLVLREWLWLGQEAFGACCSFLKSQGDQFQRIIFSTQNDSLHWLLHDPRNTSDNVFPHVYHETNASGVGLMYRIISLPGFIEATSYRNFADLSTTLTINLKDSFRPQNAGLYSLVFENGVCRLSQQPLAGPVLNIDVADLTALLMGSVDIAALYRLGKVQTAKENLTLLTKLFHAPHKPECITAY